MATGVNTFLQVIKKTAPEGGFVSQSVYESSREL